jgi:hypothetical protein
MRALLSFSIRSVAAMAALTIVMGGHLPSAHARDFLSSIFSIFSGRPPPQEPPPDSQFPPQMAPQGGGGRSTAYCVRTCDGRYFPVSANSEQSQAATCSSFCPASDTRVFYGPSIAHATSEDGKPYSSLPNAFKYREQLVNGCTCNGKDPVGLASISIDQDRTLRRGDIVAGENGLTIANRAAERQRPGATDPGLASPRMRERFERSESGVRE